MRRGRLLSAQAVPVPDASFHPSDAEMRMPPPPVVSVVIGDSGVPPRRPDTRNSKTQTETDGPNVVEELKSLASWLADHQQNNVTDGYAADGSEESNRDLTVPAGEGVPTHRTTAAVNFNTASGSEPAVSTQQGTDAGLDMGLRTSLDRTKPASSIGESNGAADLA